MPPSARATGPRNRTGAAALKIFAAEHISPDVVKAWRAVLPKELALLPVGGITPENCGTLVRAGADFLAVIAAVWSHPEGPAAGVRAMNAAIAAAAE